MDRDRSAFYKLMMIVMMGAHMNALKDGELKERAEAALGSGASATIVTAFFAAGGSSAARVLVWPSACLKDLAKPRGRAELLFALETEFVGWGLSMSSIVIRASGDSSATIALEPLGMGLGLEGQPRSVRDMLQARGFERLAQALDQVFGCACSALPYDFPGCGLLGLDEAAKSFSPKSIGRDPVELVAAMEALACASQMEADIQNGRPASGGARL